MNYPSVCLGVNIVRDTLHLEKEIKLSLHWNLFRSLPLISKYNMNCPSVCIVVNKVRDTLHLQKEIKLSLEFFRRCLEVCLLFQNIT